jgi:hypothetical protein
MKVSNPVVRLVAKLEKDSASKLVVKLVLGLV